MAENLSLADRAVQALALVNAMDQGMSLDHPERHVIRALKQVAQDSIGDGLRRATEIAYQVEYLRTLIRETEAGKEET